MILENPRHLKKVAVVGGGVSGIGFCYRLEKLSENVEIHLFEADKRLGGKIKSFTKNGFLFECGPDCFLREKPLPLEIARELNFDDDVVEANEETKGTHVYARGKLHKLPEGVVSFVPTKAWPIVFTGLFSVKGKLRMGLELFLPRYYGLKGNYDETLSDFVIRRFGKEALDRLAAPLVAGIYASDPDEISVAEVFPRFLEMEEKYGSLIKGFLSSGKKTEKRTSKFSSYFLSFKYGMQQLVDEMVKNLQKTKIHTGFSVKKVIREKDGYRLSSNPEINEHFDAVVVATPTYVVADLLPDNFSKEKEALGEVKYSSVATVNLIFPVRKINPGLKGHGFVVARGEKLLISAASYMSQKWPERAPEDYLMIRTFIGGGKQSYLASLSEEELVKISVTDLQKVFGVRFEPEEVQVNRYLNAMPVYVPGHKAKMEKVRNSLESSGGLYLIGSAHEGIGVPDCLKFSFKVAEKVASFLKSR